MKPGTDFKTDQAIALLLMGSPGAGKTNLAMEWPTPYFIDWGDANLKSAKERHPGKEFYWGSVVVDENEKEVPIDRRYERGTDLLKRFGPDPKIKTIVDDSLSQLQECLQAHIVRLGSQAESSLTVGGEKVMTRSMWSPFKLLLQKRIMFARALGKPYIMTCHEKIDSDEMSSIKVWRPNLSGQMGDTIPSLFTDWWGAEAEPTSDTKRWPKGVRYYVRTMPSTRVKFKNSFDLPANFEFTWEAFTAHMEKRRAG